MRIDPKIVRQLSQSKVQSNKNEQAQLLRSFAKDLKELVKKDAADNVYMSKASIDLQKAYRTKVGPDRQKAIAQFSLQFPIAKRHSLGEYFAKLLDLPFHGQASVGRMKTTAFIYNENGEQIAFYDSWQGWSAVSTEEERVFSRSMTRIYSRMYDEAKAELAETQAQNTQNGQLSMRI